MITWAIIAGAIFGLCIAVARRYPWCGALCLFTVLTLSGIALAEFVYSEVGKAGVFGVLVIVPFAAIPETRKALKKSPVSIAAMKYIYATYAATGVLALWGIGRVIQIFGA